MNTMSIKKDDLVVVLSGKDKGKQGKVLAVLPSESKVIVEGVNVATKHKKPTSQTDQGGIVKKESAEMPRKSRTRGRAMLNRRSRNSHILS